MNHDEKKNKENRKEQNYDFQIFQNGTSGDVTLKMGMQKIQTRQNAVNNEMKRKQANRMQNTNENT